MFSGQLKSTLSLGRQTLGIFCLAAFAGLFSATTQAFPPLNLVPGTPNIASNFITVDYVGNSNVGTLTASGFANVLSPPGSPTGFIAGGTFDINANVSENALTAIGSLTIGGTVAGLGFNSGTLLTGTLDSLGAGPNDPLEFLFNVTGGDAASLYGGIGAQAGVILSQSGYGGSFAGNFSSGAFQALADTFGPDATAVPAPGVLCLMLSGLALLRLRRRSVLSQR